MAERTAVCSGINEAGSFHLATLTRWINGCVGSDSFVPRDILANDDLRVLSLAERCGIFKRAALADRLSCHYCEDPHPCTVIRSTDRVYHYECLVNGRIDVDEDDLALLVFDRAALLASLAGAAGGHVSEIRLFAGQRLARLGFIASDPNRQEAVLAYADHLDDEAVQARIIDALAAELPNGPGLVVTPSIVPMNLPLPQHYRLVKLHELFVGRSEGFSIDQEAAEIRLGRRKKTPGQPGRPTERDAVKEIWLAARISKAWPRQRNLQTNDILSQWRPEHGPRPAAKTIENHIRDFERAFGPWDPST